MQWYLAFEGASTQSVIDDCFNNCGFHWTGYFAQFRQDAEVNVAETASSVAKAIGKREHKVRRSAVLHIETSSQYKAIS